MDPEQIKSEIDYFILHQPTPWLSYLSIIAIIISLVSATIMYIQAIDNYKLHVRTEWNGILNICISHHEFIDIERTSDYNNMSIESRFIYEAFCYKTWSLFEFIAIKNLARKNPYAAMAQWIAAYHRDWLDGHPYMFVSKRFWRLYEETRNEPLTLIRNRMLPRIDAKPAREDKDLYTDSVDWDKVHESYSDWIIGPLSPVMTSPDPAFNNNIRNRLLTRLSDYEDDLRSLRIADYGCGTGNLLPFLAGRVNNVYGIDISENALKVASNSASKIGIEFTPILADMSEYVSEQKFDLIISINSVLPTKRKDVLRIFKMMRDNLSTQGRLLAILPSFDTCIALAQYWEETYRSRAKTEMYVAKSVAAFKASKKMNEANLSFADDGVHVQCFHTPKSIEREFQDCGLRIVGDMKKVLYPWEYARDFDYGYFPDKPEIWDWFVEAERAPSRR
jgi:SAM-dependent methyltransferase